MRLRDSALNCLKNGAFQINVTSTDSLRSTSCSCSVVTLTRSRTVNELLPSELRPPTLILPVGD